MYSDARRIELLRGRVIKVRLNQQENALIDALVEYTGQPKATLMRDLLMEQARIYLKQHPDSALHAVANKVA